MATQTTDLELDLAAVARKALDDRQPGENLDEALLQACKTLYPGAEKTAVTAASRALEALAERDKADRESTLRKLGDPSSPVHVRCSVHVTTRTLNAGSPQELPPDLRGKVEEMIAAGTTSGTIVMPPRTTIVAPEPSTREAGPGRQPDRREEAESYDPGAGAGAGAVDEAVSHRCAACGYVADFDFDQCPQCGAQAKRSFLSRLFGRRS